MEHESQQPPLQDSPATSSFSAIAAARLHRMKVLIKRRWWIILLTTALAIGFQGWRAFSAPDVFTSTARMMVAPQMRLPEQAIVIEDSNFFYGTQIELMRSGEVRSAAHERVAALRPELAQSPVNLNVFQAPGTSIFVFNASGPEPAYTQAYLDAVLNTFIRLKDQQREDTADTAAATLTEQLARLETELKTAHNNLFEFQKNNDIVVVQEQGNIAATYLTQLERELAEKRREVRLLEMLTLDQALLRSQPTNEASVQVGGDATATSATPTTPTTAAAESEDAALRGFTARGPENHYLRAQQEIQLLRTQFDELSRHLRPRHPKIIKLREEIDRQEGLVAIYRAQSVEQIRNRRESLLVEIRNTDESRGEWEERALATNRVMAEYASLRATVDRVNNVYERLLDANQRMGMSSNLGQINITVLEYASPASAAAKGSGRAVIVGAIAGLLLGAGILYGLDKLDDRINSLGELKEFFDLPVLGQLPHEPDADDNRRNLLGPGEERIIYAEALRNIRSALLYMPMESERPTSLLVTSAIPGEGKSTVTSNLALTMSQLGSRVLLIDGDLRKGVLHNIFDKTSDHGLADILDGRLDWASAILPSGFENLDLITRGRANRLMNELLLGEPMDRFLEQARPAYDYILIDTPPVLAADDAASMAAKFDGCVVVARASFTSARMLDRALDSLRQRQARVIGFVFNAVDISQPDYYHYRYYKDYHDRPV